MLQYAASFTYGFEAAFIADFIAGRTHSPAPAPAATLRKIDITRLFKTITDDIDKIFKNNNSNNYTELYYYIMKPINIIVNLMYYTTNIFAPIDLTGAPGTPVIQQLKDLSAYLSRHIGPGMIGDWSKFENQ